MSDMRQLRCPRCNRLIAEVSVTARVRSKCPRCKAVVSLGIAE